MKRGQIFFGFQKFPCENKCQDGRGNDNRIVKEGIGSEIKGGKQEYTGCIDKHKGDAKLHDRVINQHDFFVVAIENQAVYGRHDDDTDGYAVEQKFCCRTSQLFVENIFAVR